MPITSQTWVTQAKLAASQIISYDTFLRPHNMYPCPPRSVFHGAHLRKTVAGMVESLGVFNRESELNLPFEATHGHTLLVLISMGFLLRGNLNLHWKSPSLWISLCLTLCQFVSDSLQPRRLWHARLPCPSLSPRVCPGPCPFSQWCYPTTSSSATFFSFWHNYVNLM